jgi:putative oxygen-independent coproporphyrinogen III oxidase
MMPWKSGDKKTADTMISARRTSFNPSDFGLYVHIPFCAKRCDYCAFATWTDKDHLYTSYTNAVLKEIEQSRTLESLPEATSVFFGGGTPSLLPPKQLTSILQSLHTATDCEVTVECNPDTVSSELFNSYVGAGVNRVSFGVQSMVPHVLEALGRSHDPNNVREAVFMARDAGLEFLNLDLIYGAAGETVVDWQTSIDEVLELDPGHISAYALTVEANTALAEDPTRFPDDDDQADKYASADNAFRAAGYRNYEISNWAKPGMESRHNFLYWSQGQYRGFGCAAHSHQNGRRFWNVRTPERYISLINAETSAESASESLKANAFALEGLQLALRTYSGVPRSAFHDNDINEFVEAGLIEVVDATRVVLTQPGRLMANTVAIRLRS